MDTQSENSSENDSQQAPVKLSKVPMSFLHRSRTGETFARIPWIGHVFHAGGC